MNKTKALGNIGTKPLSIKKERKKNKGEKGKFNACEKMWNPLSSSVSVYQYMYYTHLWVLSEDLI